MQKKETISILCITFQRNKCTHTHIQHLNACQKMRLYPYHCFCRCCFKTTRIMMMMEMQISWMDGERQKNARKNKTKKVAAFTIPCYIVQLVSDVCVCVCLSVASICIECTRVFIFIKSLLLLHRLGCLARAYSP